MVPISLFALLAPMRKPAEDPHDKAAAFRWCAAFVGCDGSDLQSLRDPLEPTLWEPLEPLGRLDGDEALGAPG
jgi:hypothetical protein